jgi:antitoxin component of MazEF toxin-antitoxin module
MEPVRVAGTVRRVGNSLAVLIPVADARRAGLVAGSPIDAEIRPRSVEALGLLKAAKHRPFDRHEEDLWRERL